MIHIDKQGNEYELKDLTDSHLKNIIKFIERRAKEGVLVRYGDVFFKDIYSDEEYLFGEKALEELNYQEYINELERRNKSL